MVLGDIVPRLEPPSCQSSIALLTITSEVSSFICGNCFFFLSFFVRNEKSFKVKLTWVIASRTASTLSQRMSNRLRVVIITTATKTKIL